MVTPIWATRGYSWGFRFLLDGGYPDPLPVYERAFAGLESEPEACQRQGDLVALRLQDPLGRKDAAGRIIPHDFVVQVSLAGQVRSVEDGRKTVWPMVAEVYALVWSGRPPTSVAIAWAMDGGATGWHRIV